MNYDRFRGLNYDLFRCGIVVQVIGGVDGPAVSP